MQDIYRFLICCIKNWQEQYNLCLASGEFREQFRVYQVLLFVAVVIFITRADKFTFLMF